MRREFTATVYILKEEKVLLIFHKKHKKWLPPGGHLNEGELPFEGAIREAKEETGLDIALIPEENVWIEEYSIPRPYMCLLENIPGEPAHQHIDLIFVGRPIGGEERVNSQETDGMRWFSLREVEKLKSVYPDTVATIRHLSEKYALHPV